jgi:RNA polymerase sigma-70 factor, ECF subfamily
MRQVPVLAYVRSIGNNARHNRMGALRGTVDGGVVSDTEHLIAEQIPKLRRYARALLGDPIRADDLVQEALVRALSRSHLWQPGTDIRAWMFTILHNVHVNNQRQRRHRDDYQELSDDRPEMATPATQERILEMRDLARGLQLLPAPQREVVLLVGLEGMNYKQVAAVLDIPIGTVMSRLHRGREALRRLMTDGPASSAADQDSEVRSVP